MERKTENFDAVTFMRSRRDALSELYSAQPEREEQDLSKIRQHLDITAAKRPAPVCSTPPGTEKP
jgi:hypothetical protein